MKLSLGTKLSSGFIRHSYRNENGVALVISLMFVAILALLGTTAYVLTTTDMQIGSNYKTSLQAFNAAQAGIEEARARLRGNAANPITYASPSLDFTDPNWETYIGTDTLAQNLSGYASGDTITPSINSFTDIDYAVKIEHLTQEDPPGSGTYVVVYWGDSDGDGVSERNIIAGNNIYLVTSYGTIGGAASTVTVEITRVPPVNPLAALYVEGNAGINSKNAEVNGNDQCGGSINLAGISTPKPYKSEKLPVWDQQSSVKGNPSVEYGANDLDIQSIVNNYKGMADYTISGGTHTNQNWGTPFGTPSTPDCNDSNIVYASSNVTLTKTTGCGILLVDGNLKTQAGFQWYGLVFVTGCLANYSGNAKSDGIFGAAMCGGTCDSKVTGNVKLNYCSDAVNDATENLPLSLLSWKDNYK